MFFVVEKVSLDFLKNCDVTTTRLISPSVCAVFTKRSKYLMAIKVTTRGLQSTKL